MEIQTLKILESLLRQTRGKRPLAIVMGGSVNGLSFVRSLGRRGIPVLLLDSERLVGTYSRYGTTVLLPQPGKSPDEWMELLEFLGSKLHVQGVIFPTSDAHSLFVSQHAKLLERYFRFLVPSAEATAQIVDKKAQYTIAKSAGVLIPETHFPKDLDEVRRISTDLMYPCIVKPYKAHEGRGKIGNKKVVVVESRQSLVSVFESIGNGDPSFMVQEIIPGEDNALYGYLAFWDANHHEHAWLTKRKLRQYPPHYGDGSLQETIECQEVAQLGRKLLQAFNYQGFVGIEFKFDARDGTYRLMEINPRTVSGNQLCISAGVDFPAIGYQYLTGCDLGLHPAPPFQRGVRYVNEEWDLKAYLALRKSGELTLGSWLQSIRGAKAKALWASDDPLPILVTMSRVVRAFLRALPG
jgi:predicted ATP-grasp superfamily ATP-dependent carboligase